MSELHANKPSKIYRKCALFVWLPGLEFGIDFSGIDITLIAGI